MVNVVHDIIAQLSCRASLALFPIAVPPQKKQPWENLPSNPAGSSPRLGVLAISKKD